MPILNPGRLAAAYALMRAEKGYHADEALLAAIEPGSKDMGLARALTFGVLRRRGALDKLLGAFARDPVHKLDPNVRVAARIGLFELHCMRTPPHAAVDQAVQLTRVLRRPRAAGFVNAVLRKGGEGYLPDDPLLDHPNWMIRRWKERYGEEAVQEWCARMSEAAPLAVCLATPDSEAPEGEPATAMGLPVPGVRWVDAKGRVDELPGFETGAWWVMDPAAAAAADLLEVQTGERVLDACAAPGGKTLRLASQGADVVAADRRLSRLERVQESLDRTGLKATLEKVDWNKDQPQLGSFDAVLVDAPCTGLGTTRRHPEIRWSRQASDPLAQSLLQGVILANASLRVKPGGRLVYAVCSPEPEEGRDVVQEFLSRRPEWRLDAELETAPPQSHEDAFYAARLVHQA